MTEAEKGRRGRILRLMLGGGVILDCEPEFGSEESKAFGSTMLSVTRDEDIRGLDVSRFVPPQFRAELREIAPEVR